VGRLLVIVVFASLVLGGAACSGAAGAGSNARVQRGKASWYGGKWHGRKTASGERFNKRALTAAHRKLPFGTIVVVTNLSNGRSVKVRINDRGPFIRGRIIDVSEAAARRLKMRGAGVVRCKLRVIKYGKGKYKRARRRRHRYRSSPSVNPTVK